MKTTLKYFVALGALATALFAPPMSLEQRVSETEDRLDEIEFQSGLDKIKFGLDFSVGANDSSFKIGEQVTQQGTQAEQKYKAHNKWSMELNLNMNAAINDYTKFYGRLSMAKNFAMLDPNYDRAYDYSAGRDLRTSGQSLYVTRAYVDLFFSPEIVATLGRQPGTDGPGSNLRNNAKRQGTYPALIVNTLGDAAVLTYKPNFAKRLQFAVRGAYGKIYQYDKEGNVKDFMSKGETADSDLYYASFEIQPHLGALGRSNLFMVSYARLHDLALDISGNATLDTWAQATPTIGRELGVETLGTIDTVNVHFESFEAFRLPLNYFVSGSYMKGSNAKGVGAHTLPNATKKLFNEESAYAIHAGLRYDFHRYFKLGGEYFYGSQYWFAMSNASFNDPFNIRTTRGQAYDVYIISQIDRNQFFRLSYTHIQNKWTNRNIPLNGSLSKDDVGGYESTADSVMLIYNVKF